MHDFEVKRYHYLIKTHADELIPINPKKQL